MERIQKMQTLQTEIATLRSTFAAMIQAARLGRTETAGAAGSSTFDVSDRPGTVRAVPMAQHSYREAFVGAENADLQLDVLSSQMIASTDNLAKLVTALKEARVLHQNAERSDELAAELDAVDKRNRQTLVALLKKTRAAMALLTESYLSSS